MPTNKMPTICQGCGYICNSKKPLGDILYYCFIFRRWLCDTCYNLPGPQAWSNPEVWAERRKELAEMRKT